MGRKKLNPANLRIAEQPRKDSFFKRCKGLFKKAHDLATLCGSGIYMLVEGEDGRLFGLHRKKSLVVDCLKRKVSKPATAASTKQAQRNSKRLFYNPCGKGGKMEETGMLTSEKERALLGTPSSASDCSCYDCIYGNSLHKADVEYVLMGIPPLPAPPPPPPHSQDHENLLPSSSSSPSDFPPPSPSPSSVSICKDQDLYDILASEVDDDNNLADLSNDSMIKRDSGHNDNPPLTAEPLAIMDIKGKLSFGAYSGNTDPHEEKLYCMDREGYCIIPTVQSIHGDAFMFSGNATDFGCLPQL